MIKEYQRQVFIKVVMSLYRYHVKTKKHYRMTYWLNDKLLDIPRKHHVRKRFEHGIYISCEDVRLGNEYETTAQSVSW
jgi:hypothetical protein